MARQIMKTTKHQSQYPRFTDDGLIYIKHLVNRDPAETLSKTLLTDEYGSLLKAIQSLNNKFSPISTSYEYFKISQGSVYCTLIYAMLTPA